MELTRDPDDMLTPEQLCERLNITAATLKGWRRHGKGPKATGTAGQSLRYCRVDIEQWLEGTKNPRKTMCVPSYVAIHARKSRQDGRASDHLCVDCGDVAQDWSYDNADPREIFALGLHCAYSLDLSHYVARCAKCHRRFDRDHAMARAA